MGHRGIQAAMEWLLEHNEDPDIDDPIQPPVGQKLNETSTTAGNIIYILLKKYCFNIIFVFKVKILLCCMSTTNCFVFQIVT